MSKSKPDKNYYAKKMVACGVYWLFTVYSVCVCTFYLHGGTSCFHTVASLAVQVILRNLHRARYGLRTLQQ